MTDWTKEDTEALRRSALCENCCFDHTGPGPSCKHGGQIEHRAAAHIEALEARVAELESFIDKKKSGHKKVLSETQAACAYWKDQAVASGRELRAQRATAIPRAALVSAMREVSDLVPSQHHSVIAGMLSRLADEIERGEWPRPKEGE